MIVEQRVEGIVADPGLVPQHVVAEMSDLLQHLADVVDRPVIGRELDAGEPEGAFCLVALLVRDQRIRLDLLPQVFLVPSIPVDGADHAERIARGRQKDRYRTGLNQGALMQRFVIVAVEENQVAAPQHGICHHLVGRARAV